MATKKTPTPSMTDVTRSDKVTPPASGRPIIVSNHSVLPSDPMVVNEEEKDSTEAAPGSTPVISRQAKTIVPISHDIAPEAEATDEPSAPAESTLAANKEGVVPEDASEQVTADTASKKMTAPEPAEEEPQTADKPGEAEAAAPSDKTEDEPADDESADDEVADQDAPAKDANPEADKKLAAAEARERELEALIESGKYAVPINVEHNHRSVLSWLLWALLVVAVIVVALDLLLDAGMLTLQVPHTNFLTTYKP